jgi:hypothetical protein
MNLITGVRALLVVCMSCALGACAMAEPDEADSEEAAVVSAEDKGPEVAPESFAPPGGGESDAVACGGNGNWCLARCSKTGVQENIIGSKSQLGGTCAGPGETFCQSHGLGYRTHACWGHL